MHYILKEATLRPVDDGDIEYIATRSDLVILAMGPTGAGKSRFIEALAGDDHLGISGDQLDSVTQTVVTYELVERQYWQGPGTQVESLKGKTGNRRIYVLDTPGFSDSQTSEVEIIEMVNGWMKAHSCPGISIILYFCPITDTRLPGSKRRTIGMLKLLSRVNSKEPGTVMVITTMWDRLWNEQRLIAAEDRFIQLRDKVWKDLLNAGGTLSKFTNTHESALNIASIVILQQASTLKTTFVAFYNPEMRVLPDADFRPHLYQDLLDRIEGIKQQKEMIEFELSQPAIQMNQELKSSEEARLQKADLTLTKFETQLIRLGDPPEGFHNAIPMRHAIIEKFRQPGAQASDNPSLTTSTDLGRLSVAVRSRPEGLRRLLRKGLESLKNFLKNKSLPSKA